MMEIEEVGPTADADSTLIGLLADYNKAALAHREDFRRSAAIPSPFDANFFDARTQYPYFGYVLAEFEDANPFWMFNNDDDLVAQHFFWFGHDAYEPITMNMWLTLARRATCIYDVGAFSGVYGLAARMVNDQAAVHFFEPTVRGFSRLLDNIKANLLMNSVEAHRLALGATAGEVTMYHFRTRHELGSGVSYIRKAHEANIVESERCDVTTLAMCAVEFGTPDLVKIDVEEAEVDVLDGATGLVEGQSASFVIEVVPSTIDAVLSRLDGYSCLLVDESTETVLLDDDPTLRATLERAGFANLVAVVSPKVRRNLLDGAAKRS